MTPLGFYTISGISVVSQALLSGGRIATAWPFSPETAWQAIGRDQANVLAVAPSMLEAMLNRRNPGDGTSLLVVGVGAAAASPSLLARSEAELGCPVVVGYGSTELGGGVLATDPWDRERAPGEVGSALEGCDWRIVDPSGHTVPHGSIGELAHRSPGMMLGYQTLGNTTGADREGWYRTGDLAVADASGSIRIEGRIDGRISRGGLNIYPSEIERILRSHPEVDECAVVGKPTRSGEHEILAFVSPTPGSTPLPEALARWCANSLAPQKLPDRIEITATLPRTDAGEVRKANLLQASPKPSLPRSVGLGQRDPDGRPRIER